MSLKNKLLKPHFLVHAYDACWMLPKDILRTFRKFEKNSLPFKEKLKLYRGIRFAHFNYGWNAEEFLLYHFSEIDNTAREEYIGEDEHRLISYLLNPVAVRDILYDKWKTYLEFKPFFGREACVVKDGRIQGALKSMISKNDRLIFKPLDGSLGRGIQILPTSGMSEHSVLDMLSSYPSGFIVEELIIQVPEMQRLHPQSVNTLRIHTICFNDDVTIFHPYIRMGRGNSVVDNAGSGGIFTSNDKDTGEVLTVVDEFGNQYTEHPDTHFNLVGFKVPCWKEAFDLAAKLARHLSGVHYAGWDLALTKDGWVMVEGNPKAQYVFQIAEQHGFRSELKSILSRYGINYRSKYEKNGMWS